MHFLINKKQSKVISIIPSYKGGASEYVLNGYTPTSPPVPSRYKKKVLKLLWKGGCIYLDRNMHRFFRNILKNVSSALRYRFATADHMQVNIFLYLTRS